MSRGFRGPKWDRDIIVVGQNLPDDFARTLRRMRGDRDTRLDGVLRLALDEGWTASAIGRAMRITRERVLQRAAAATGPAWGVDIPPPPRRIHPPKPTRPQLPPDVAALLRQMSGIARTVNGATHADDPRRKVSVEYAALLAELVAAGWPIKYLSRVVGVTHGAIRFRLGRHGHMRPVPSMAGQTYLGRPATGRRRRRWVGGECSRGHLLVADNVLVEHGNVRCATCKRAQQRAYYLRKKKERSQ